jgi:type IV pilus assembly protein PilE
LKARRLIYKICELTPHPVNFAVLRAVPCLSYIQQRMDEQQDEQQIVALKNNYLNRTASAKLNLSTFRGCGFTLLELLITMAIMALLLTLAIPHYSHYITAVRRATVITTLHDVAGRLEQFYGQNNSYEGATLENLGVDQERYKNFYNINITSATADTYTIQAAPIGVQERADKICGTLTINHENQKTISGSGTVKECWE